MHHKSTVLEILSELSEDPTKARFTVLENRGGGRQKIRCYRYAESVGMKMDDIGQSKLEGGNRKLLRGPRMMGKAREGEKVISTTPNLFIAALYSATQIQLHDW